MRFSTLTVGFMAAVAANAATLYSRDDLDFDAYRTQVLQPDSLQELWNGVGQHINAALPGIQCTLGDDWGNNTIEASLKSVRSDYCTALEDELKHMFPSIQCHGDLDLDTYLDNAKTPSPTGAALLPRASTNAVIEAKKNEDEDKADAKSQSFVTSCSGATHPGNCRACALGYGAAAVGEIGVCAAAAYAALGSTAGIATPAVVAGMTSCGAAALTSLWANINGCWTR